MQTSNSSGTDQSSTTSERARGSDTSAEVNARVSQPFQAKKFDFSSVQGLSTRALEIHEALYEGYVKESNALLPLLKNPRPAEASTEQRLQVDGLVRRFAFERNGMILHELFFESLRGANGQPSSGVFTEALRESYGGFAEWQNDIRRLAQTRGIGWVLTMQSSTEGRLSNVWIEEHTVGLLAEHRIVFALDVWEHAYLIDYRPTERLQYMQTVFDNIDWSVIEKRCR